MKRNYKLFIDDIRESISLIEDYTKNISEEEFKKDKKLQDAIIRRLEIMGEASKNIPSSLKEKNKQVLWFEISHFRNLIIHSYFEISPSTIWRTVKERIPKIKESIRKIALI